MGKKQLIIVGLVILSGIGNQMQQFVLNRGWYDPVGRLEESLI